MNKERLLRLAEHLETKVSPETFDMGRWWGPKDNDCGYAGCAVGHACTIPEFREAGLKANPVALAGNHCRIEYEDDFGFGAVCTFFGLRSQEARALFGEHAYEDANDPLPVAAAVRAFVAAKEEMEKVS